MPLQSTEARSGARLLILFGLAAVFATVHILQHRQAMRQRHPRPVNGNDRRPRSRSRRRRRAQRGGLYDHDQHVEHGWNAWQYGQNERPHGVRHDYWDDDDLDGRTVISGMDGLHDRDGYDPRPGRPASVIRPTWDDYDGEDSTLVDEPMFRESMNRRRGRR